MSEWVSEWVSELLSEWVIEWVSDWVIECVSEWVSEWVSEPSQTFNVLKRQISVMLSGKHFIQLQLFTLLLLTIQFPFYVWHNKKRNQSEYLKSIKTCWPKFWSNAKHNNNKSKCFFCGKQKTINDNPESRVIVLSETNFLYHIASHEQQ